MNIPSPGEPRSYRFPALERQSGPDGSALICATLTKLPLVTVTVVFPRAGAANEPQGREGIAQLTASMLLEGTPSRDGAAIADAFERIGASLSIAADWDCTSASVTAQRDHMPAAVELLRDVLQNPAFRDDDLSRLKGEHESDRLQLIADPRSLADAAFVWTCYQANGSRFRKPIDGTIGSIGTVSRDDVVKFWKERGAPPDISIVVAGDASAEIARGYARVLLDGWPRSASSSREPVPAALSANATTTLVHKAGAAQTELRIGHVGVPRAHPRYFELTVMNAVLGGLFSSRINLNLRERHGYTYGAFSGFDWRVDAGPWTVSTAVKSEVTGAAIREVRTEIDRIRAEPITADELELATKYLVGVFPLRFETTSAVSSALSSLVVYGLQDDYFDVYRTRIAAVTPNDVLDAALAHLHPESLQIIAAGDPEVLRAQIGGASSISMLTPDDVEVAR